MARHTNFCISNNPLEFLNPKNDQIFHLVNWQKPQQCLFVVHADLEDFQIETHSLSRETREIDRPFPASYGWVLVDNKG